MGPECWPWRPCVWPAVVPAGVSMQRRMWLMSHALVPAATPINTHWPIEGDALLTIQ
jgi:hypothetical protein